MPFARVYSLGSAESEIEVEPKTRNVAKKWMRQWY
jgi:hypothetical protein